MNQIYREIRMPMRMQFIAELTSSQSHSLIHVQSSYSMNSFALRGINEATELSIHLALFERTGQEATPYHVEVQVETAVGLHVLQWTKI